MRICKGVYNGNALLLNPQFRLGGTMGFWRKLCDLIMGYDIISVDDAVMICTDAIKSCDVNGNGMLNAGEIVRTVKASLKAFRQ